MLIFLLTLFITAAYFIIKRHYSQWQRLGFCTDEPIIPYGTLRKVFWEQQPFALLMCDIYEKFHSKVVGIYLFFTPAILVRDAELARQIMTSDFGSFHDRGIYLDEKTDPMSAQIFTVKGQQWRMLRNKLTATFSSGNLKRMFDSMDFVADKLIKHINEQLSDGKTHILEMKDLSTSYAADIIGSVIFGLDIDSFANRNNELRLISDGFFEEPPLLQRFRNFAILAFPPLANFLARLGIRDSVTNRFRDILKHTIEFREKNGIVRKDLLQSLIQLKNTGKILDDNDQGQELVCTVKSRSIDMIAANAFLFYIAGSETPASTISFTIYELAMNRELFEKAQKEVDQCLEKHNLQPEGRFTYEAIQDLKFLDLCVKETTRKYPGLPFLNRECTQDFRVPDTKLTIRKGTGIIIPLQQIHRDEKYFPQPMDYRPERFSDDIQEYCPVAYMPFGEGPRHCIAQRMGMVNVKVALAKILANFNIEHMPRKEVEYIFHTAPVLVPKEGLLVGLSKRY